MKHKNKVALSCLVGASAICLALAANGLSWKFVRITGSEKTYSLSFDESHNLPNFGEDTISVKTNDGNDVSFNYSGLASAESSFAKISNGGYFQNDSKLSGLTGLKATFAGGNLKISYAWEDKTMLVEETLTSGETFSFQDKTPSYFKISNESGNEVTLDSLNLTYNCQEVIKKVVKINYLKKSDSSKLADPTYLILDEGEYYGEENVSGKGALTIDSTKYLPNRYWVAGFADDNKVIDITYTPASVYDGTISTSLLGAGTDEDPYQINSAADLAYWESNSHTASDAHSYVINTSIDMTGYSWTGICNKRVTNTSYMYFNGNLEGNDYTIGGLTSPENCNYTALGFISCTNAAKTIQNLVLEGNFSSASTRAGGGLSYYPRSGTIKNIISYVNFTSTNASGGQFSASLIGTSSTNVTVVDCESYGTVIGGAANTGGITGNVGAGATIKSCRNYSRVYAGTSNTGGIAGNVGDVGATITDCVNYGHVSASKGSGVGGIAGICVGKIFNSTNYGEVSSTFEDGANGAQAGGILGAAGGSSKPATVGNCRNYGYVHAILKGVAGIIGWNTNASLCYGCVNGGVIDSNASNTVGSILGYCGAGSHAYGYTTPATEEYTACSNEVGAKVFDVAYPSENGDFVVVGYNNNDGGAAIAI